MLIQGLSYKSLTRINFDNTVPEMWQPAEDRKCGEAEGKRFLRALIEVESPLKVPEYRRFVGRAGVVATVAAALVVSIINYLCVWRSTEYNPVWHTRKSDNLYCSLLITNGRVWHSNGVIRSQACGSWRCVLRVHDEYKHGKVSYVY